MRRVVIDMQNALFADAVAGALRRFDFDFDPVMSESPDKTLSLCDAVLANVLIMEVTAYTPWRFEERMKIRDELRKVNPDCKIVFVVDENTEKKLADKVRRAKKDGLIDNFIYNLVFCNSSGRPMEGQVITHALKKLIRENDLPDVVFHSFRHASITYKLKWNGGDVKSVQGDSGHARAEMVSNVYSHIIDED